MRQQTREYFVKHIENNDMHHTTLHVPEEATREVFFWLHHITLIISCFLNGESSKGTGDRKPQDVHGEVATGTNPPAVSECLYRVKDVRIYGSIST